MKYPRWQSILLCLVIIVPVLISCGGSPQPSPVAEDLASKLTQAKTDEAKYQMLLSIMQRLNIGVYRATGEAILHGAERGPKDFYLYDFELRMMAQSLVRGQTWRLEDVVETLKKMGIDSPEQPLTTRMLWDTLRTGLESASQHQDERLSFLPLLVRALGLRQPKPYDLLQKGLLPENVKLDALQQWLILIDISLPIVREGGPATGTTMLPATTGGVLKFVQSVLPQDPCKEIGSVVKEEWSAGKWLLSFVKTWKLGDKIKVTAAIIDGLHGSVLAFSVDVRALDDRLETHYGHESPGKELHFRVKVQMLDALPDQLVKCGWLLGVEFPKQGPIPDITVLWFTEEGDLAEGSLAKHGTFPSCSTVCTTKTGSDGVAILVFQPKSEAPPYGQGLQKEDSGVVSGLALYQSKHKNVLGSISQIITPKSGSTRWFIQYHEHTSETWSGTITWSEITQVKETTGLPGGTQLYQETTNYVWNIQLVGGQASESVKFNKTDHTEQHQADNCLKVDTVDDGNVNGSGQSKEDDVSVKVNVQPNGTYTIEFNSINVEVHGQRTTTVTQIGLGDHCLSNTTSNTGEDSYIVVDRSYIVDGLVDPMYPNLLRGNQTKTTSAGATGKGTRTTTVSWVLTRDT